MDLTELTDEALNQLIAAAMDESRRRSVMREAEERIATIETEYEARVSEVAGSFLSARDDLTEGPAPWVQPQGAHDAYPKKWEVTHGGKVWISLVAANSHEPGVSGWRIVSADGPAPWVQPSGEHDAYDLGEDVTHDGKVWNSTTSGNVWEPGVYGWEEVVTEEPPVEEPEEPTDPEPGPSHPEGYVGVWSKDARYEVGNVVERGGVYYRCKVAHGAEYQGTWGPPQASVWDVVG